MPELLSRDRNNSSSASSINNYHHQALVFNATKVAFHVIACRSALSVRNETVSHQKLRITYGWLIDRVHPLCASVFLQLSLTRQSFNSTPSAFSITALVITRSRLNRKFNSIGIRPSLFAEGHHLAHASRHPRNGQTRTYVHTHTCAYKKLCSKFSKSFTVSTFGWKHCVDFFGRCVIWKNFSFVA